MRWLLFAGTAALHMAVKLAGVKSGEKVFCSDLTFDATVNPVVYEGESQFLLIQSTLPEYVSCGAGKKLFELYPEVKTVADCPTLWNTWKK